VKLGTVVEAIDAYLETALVDAPKGSGEHAEMYWSMFAGVVASLAATFGWSESEIRRMPVRRAFQDLKIARKRNDPQAPLFNSISGAIKAAWLKDVHRAGGLDAWMQLHGEPDINPT
jgi:hypothetical protein